MGENKRLLKHATKVIETVGFVVDSIGDEAMTNKLNKALVKLVESHLKRNIGFQEFKNLGVVLLDFICDINNRRSIGNKQEFQLNKSGDSIDHSSNEDSETMTSTLDRIRSTTSSSSSSEEDSFSNARTSATAINEINENFRNSVEVNKNESINNEEDQSEEDTAKVDPNSLIVAWTRLYKIILDLVLSEEENRSILNS